MDLTPTQKLVEDVHKDHQDRSENESRLRALDNHRLGVRKKNNIYPNAPNFLEPLIDDNVRDSVLQEMAVLFGSRRIAVFLALSPEATKVKESIESGFDNMLRMMLGLSAKLENAIDTKRSLGYSIIKQVENDTAYDRFVGFDYKGQYKDLQANELPDIEVVNIFDFVVPTNTRFLREAERCAQLHRYSIREFKKAGKDFGWDNVDKVLKKCQHNRSSDGESGNDDHETTRGTFGMDYRIGHNDVTTSVSEIITYEVYHFGEDGTRMRSIVCPDAPDDLLHQAPWVWSDGVERPWPFAQLRNENRSLYFYDTRGDAELLLDNQKIATVYANVKGIQLDHFGHPKYTGSKKAIQQMGRGPGAWVPEGVSIVEMPQINPQFDMSADAERAKAARRTGASQGGFASKSGGDKTATQINAEGQTSTRQVNWSGVRDGDPLGDIFMMMWDWLRHNPIALPLFDSTGGSEGAVERTAFDLPFIVRSVNASQNSNPDFVLQQLQVIGQQLITSPFLRREKYDRLLVDQINPQFTDELIVDPEAMGPEGQPSIQQQIMQIAQAGQQVQEAVMQNQQSIKDLAGTVEELVKYMKETAEADLQEDEADAETSS